MSPEGSVTVHDGRGREVRTCFPPGRHATIDVRGVLAPESFERICQSVGARIERESRGAMIALGILVGVVGVALLTPAFFMPHAVILWMYGLPAMTGSVLIVWAAMRFRPRMPPVDAEALATAVGAEGICAACGYRLDDLPVEDDGCVVCPECGAAWKRDLAIAPTMTQ